MKRYIYKIQWLVHGYNDLEKIILLLGIRSLDKICVLRADDYKKIDSYDDHIMYDEDAAVVKAMEYFHSKELEYEKHGNYVFEILKY